MSRPMSLRYERHHRYRTRDPSYVHSHINSHDDGHCYCLGSITPSTQYMKPIPTPSSDFRSLVARSFRPLHEKYDAASNQWLKDHNDELIRKDERLQNKIRRSVSSTDVPRYSRHPFDQVTTGVDARAIIKPDLYQSQSTHLSHSAFERRHDLRRYYPTYRAGIHDFQTWQSDKALDRVNWSVVTQCPPSPWYDDYRVKWRSPYSPPLRSRGNLSKVW